MRRILVGLAILALLAAPGCAMSRKSLEQPKLSDDIANLMQETATLPTLPEPATASGSLWTSAGMGAALTRDPRAFRLNDLVTVVLQERSLGTNESQTDLNRSSEADIGAGIAFGFEKANPQTGKFNINQVLSSDAETKFSGDGATTRSNLLTGNITTRVRRVLPNGDLVVAGQKTVMINRERHILTLVGSIRPFDVGPDNRVASSTIGDLTVRLWGRGEIDSTIRQGWFMRVMNRVWPF